VHADFARAGPKLDHEIVWSRTGTLHDRPRDKGSDIQRETGTLVILQRLIIERVGWMRGSGPLRYWLRQVRSPCSAGSGHVQRNLVEWRLPALASTSP
jgi:hypothetical protein